MERHKTLLGTHVSRHSTDSTSRESRTAQTDEHKRWPRHRDINTEREKETIKPRRSKRARCAHFHLWVCVCETSEFDDTDLATQLTVYTFL